MDLLKLTDLDGIVVRLVLVMLGKLHEAIRTHLLSSNIAFRVGVL
jgi:hypothetical protein